MGILAEKDCDVDYENMIHNLYYKGFMFKCDPCDFEKYFGKAFERLYKFPYTTYSQFTDVVGKDAKCGYCVVCRMRYNQRSLFLCSNCVNSSFDVKGWYLIMPEKYNFGIEWRTIRSIDDSIVWGMSSEIFGYVRACRKRLVGRFYKKSIMLFLMGRFDDGSTLFGMLLDIVRVVLLLIY